MSVSQEIVKLLADIVDARCGRSELARWLAEHSLRFLESNDSLDAAIVTDLDVALGEVQREAEREQYIRETAWRIVQSLGLSLPGGPTIVVIGAPPILTGSSNSGGPVTPTTVVEAVVRSS